MEPSQFYVCKRCKGEIPRIMKDLHKIKCKSKRPQTTNQVYESDFEAKQEKYLMDHLLNQIETITTSSNQFSVVNTNSSIIPILSSQAQEINNPSNFSYARENMNRNNSVMVNNSINLEFVNSSNNFSISSNNLVIESQSNSFNFEASDKYEIDFEKAKINLKGKNLYQLIKFIREVTDKINIHFNKISFLLHEIINQDLSKDLEIQNNEIVESIKSSFVEICYYIKEDQSKLEEIMNFDEEDANELQLEIEDSMIMSLKRAYENFYEIRKILESNKLSLREVEVLLPLIGVYPLSNSVVSCLPQSKVNSKDLNEFNSCVICQFNYEEDDNAITLPCLHIYHPKCIKMWFLFNNTCPICKIVVGENI